MAITPYTDVIAWNNAEGGVAGTQVTAGNSGGASGTAFAVQKPAGSISFESSSPIHDTLHYVIAPAAALALLRWDRAVVGDQTHLYFTVYVQFPAWPTAYSPFMEGKDADSGNLSFRLAVSSSGLLRLYNSSAGAAYSGTAPLSLNTTYRIEGEINCITGFYAINVYLGDSATVISGSSSSGTNSFAVQIAQINFGRILTPEYVVKFDSMAIDTAPIGPRALPSNTAFPVSITSNDGFTANTGTILGALGDSDNATYLSSPAAPTADKVVMLMNPLIRTEVVTVEVDGQASDALNTIARTIVVKNGATTLVTDGPFNLTTSIVKRQTVTPAPVAAGVQLTVEITDNQ